MKDKKQEKANATETKIAYEARHVEEEGGIKQRHKLSPVESPEDVSTLIWDMFCTWSTLEATCSSLLRYICLIELQMSSLRQCHNRLLVPIVKAVIIVDGCLIIATLCCRTPSKGCYWLLIVRTTLEYSGY